MKKIALLLTIAMFVLSQAVSAQSRTVTGLVTAAENGLSLPGVSIVVKGTSIGTVTNIDGNYSLNVPSDATTLVFSFVGLETKEVAINSDVINVALNASSLDVDEVMVVAYGTTKKSSFTGAATTVKGEKLEKMQSSNLSKSLEGTVSGVQIASGSGQPGDGASIRIRGLGSLSASQQPLIVVDGVPYEGSLNSIASQDIEALTVLKDAAANSMYGARGSNGVILITTKKGKSGKNEIKFDAKYGWNTRAVPTYDIITDAGDYYEMFWEALRNNYYDDGNGAALLEANYMASRDLIDGNLGYNVYKDIPNNQVIDPLSGQLNPNATEKLWPEEWTTVPFKSGQRQEYNLNFSGGTDNSNYYSSIGYLGDEGYIDGSNFDRISARIKVEQEITDFFKVGGNMSYAGTTQNTAMSADNLTAYSNVFMFSQQIAPIYPVYLYDHATGELMLDKDGNKRYDFGSTYARPYASEQNPVSVMNDNLNEFKSDNFSSRGFFQVKFLKDFTFTANVAYDLFNSNNTEYDTPNGGDAANVGGRGYKYTQRYAALNANQLLNYEKEFGANTVTALFGHETKHDESRFLLGHMTNFVNSDNPEFANATVYQDLTSYKNEYALEGYFSRVEYDYNDKYYLSASLRYDGSSRFHPDVRWGNFWSVGGSWRISEEEFMGSLQFIDNMKIKASYGTQGNDNIGTWYAYKDLYEINRVDGAPAMNLTFRGNPDLTWEKSQNFNAGIEASLFDRMTLEADYFIKQVDDMLYQSPLASSLGNPNWIYRNEMDMKNTGFEFELGYDVINSNDVNWNISVNGTHYKNELTRLPVTKDPEGYQAGSYWRKLGGSIYDFYTYEYVGVDPENGLPLYNKYTEAEDGTETIETVNKTSDATLRETGKSAIPDFYGGLSTTVDAYGIDFSVQTSFQLGGYVWDSGYQNLMNGGEIGGNFHKDIYKRWSANNTDTDVPRVYLDDRDISASSDRWLTDASYFNIRNITLGYTFPEQMAKKVKLSKLRVYVVADNVFFISARKGLDTRQSFTGSTGFNYSALRAVSFGVSLSL
ncbi:SusC/RagA family TonB-linked outer membrane protein [Roseimarinus sediminis]|uniref:SusC/RagA family TonB-linked outer membrane protein n=1 Tax=Roseimarinus sediminis TaxID=1610899 RepID=UPI003D1F2F2C